MVLGLVQGIFEWLPVSSEGLVAAAYTLLYDADLDEAVGFALWLHLGTAPAALVALRREVIELARGLLARPFEALPGPRVSGRGDRRQCGRGVSAAVDAVRSYRRRWAAARCLWSVPRCS